MSATYPKNNMTLIPHLSLKNVIATTCISIMGLLSLSVYFVIYNLVENHSFKTIDNFLDKEVDVVANKYKLMNGAVFPSTQAEWEEKEHNLTGHHSVFIQFIDNKYGTMEKSPNLKDKRLLFNKEFDAFDHYDAEVSGFSVRQVHFPIFSDNEVLGYVIIATPSEETLEVLSILRKSFILTFPFFLIILFYASRYMAYKSINPIKKIIDISKQISHRNLSVRIPLSSPKDELYVLSVTINELLDRIEEGIKREKSFISFTSHEFKTPLSAIKGTIQVLTRKRRKVEEYEEKLKYCVAQIDKLNNIIENLILLTQYETDRSSIRIEAVSLKTTILKSLDIFQPEITQKKITINFIEEIDYRVDTDDFMITAIMENLLSNAVKYSFPQGAIDIILCRERECVTCMIRNYGVIIAKEEQGAIFNPFFRSAENIEYAIKGHGLGLSIVKQFCDLLEINLSITSNEKTGTAAVLTIPLKIRLSMSP